MDLNTELLGNPLWRYLAAAATYVVLATLLFAAVPLVRRAAARRASKSLAGLPVAIILRIRKGLLTIVALSVALHWLDLSPGLRKVLDVVIFLGLGLQLGYFLVGAVEFFFEREEHRRVEEDAAPPGSFGVLRVLARILVWVTVLLIVLSNVGIDVTGLAASLGIGGIAVALAAQNILGDLFGSLSIVLDRPFEVGHFIVVGEHMGTVERIGLKTTRVRSLGGEQLVFSNNDLLSSRIKNYRRMQERRIVFHFGLLYSSPAEALRRVPSIVREIIEALDGTRFDRAHFQRFADSSLNFEVVYYVLSADYAVYMDVQQAINLELLERMRAEGLDFAFPTTSLHLESMPPPKERPRPAIQPS